MEGQFSDLKIQVLDVFCEDDMVATRKHIQFEALENFKVVDGKIVESWGYWPDKEIEQKLN